MRRARGFTLVEVLIVVAVITILTSVAWPSYSRYVKRGYRAAAQQFMMDISSREEQYLLDARAYTAALDGTGLNLVRQGWTCSATTCSNANYDITVTATAGPPPGYTINATALGSQVSDGNLSLNNLGAKTPANYW
ncbi:MAG: prepilin-type N-terminal cleavage/methylation domain-containing protein [Betaproteobacteria bacterium]|nr:MAG: prepilin-type N-terminal cleavage/methylation domain-containing protein [Betaproteobacteria bacterium]